MQARTMGTHAAQCMFNDAMPPEAALLTGMHFELFTHVTQFCGKKAGPATAPHASVPDCRMPLCIGAPSPGQHMLLTAGGPGRPRWCCWDSTTGSG